MAYLVFVDGQLYNAQFELPLPADQQQIAFRIMIRNTVSLYASFLLALDTPDLVSFSDLVGIVMTNKIALTDYTVVANIIRTALIAIDSSMSLFLIGASCLVID